MSFKLSALNTPPYARKTKHGMMVPQRATQAEPRSLRGSEDLILYPHHDPSLLAPYLSFVCHVGAPRSLIPQGDGRCLSMSIVMVFAHPVSSCSASIGVLSVLARMATRGALNCDEDTQCGAHRGHGAPAVYRVGRTLHPSNTS